MNLQFIKNHLFKISLAVSFLIHASAYGLYMYSGNALSNTKMENTEQTVVDFDIPPEMVGGEKNPAKVETKDWKEGSRKDDKDPPPDEEEELKKVSGDGKDKDGFMFSPKGDRPPKLIIEFDTRPYYPEKARSANITTQVVTIVVRVDEKGNLVSVVTESDDGGLGFNEAALAVIKRGRFSPGYFQGKPVAMVHRFPFRFNLEEDD